MVPKFRAWDKEQLCWINIATLNFDGEFWYLAPAMDDFNPVYYESELGETWELMQSTGLKDNNGVEIFEGDVVQWGDTPDWEEKPIRVAVVKINPDIQFDSNVGIFQYGQFAYQDTERFLTILGNIYENPELLEVEG